MSRQEELRQIPKVDEMLQEERLVFLMEKTSHIVVREELRAVLQTFREEILSGKREKAPSVDEVAEAVLSRAAEVPPFHLRHVINATGVVLHTNLGRALLSKRARDAVNDVMTGYSNLEYNIGEGTRGSRHDHVAPLLCALTGAEDALVVNNNAAAVTLCLAALTTGREVILSRGELVEIGGSFRVPEIMEESGCTLREVGTTNRTSASDYERAIGENTGALLKVHTSNYRIVGFTREATLAELAELKERYRLPLIYDMGSGLFCDLSRYGIDEPTIRQALDAGADIVLFSGDKMLGGPQGGFAVGKKIFIEAMKRHPLARAFRVDKLTLAAAEATLYEYQDPDRAREEIPFLRMVTQPSETLRERAEKLCTKLQVAARDSAAAAGQQLTFSVEPCVDRVGGGAAPTSDLEGFAVTVGGADAHALETALRKGPVPIVATTQQDKVRLSMRTIQDGEEEQIAAAFSTLVLPEGEDGSCRM